jgi:hypothetical protein
MWGDDPLHPSRDCYVSLAEHATAMETTSEAPSTTTASDRGLSSDRDGLRPSQPALSSRETTLEVEEALTEDSTQEAEAVASMVSGVTSREADICKPQQPPSFPHQDVFCFPFFSSFLYITSLPICLVCLSITILNETNSLKID